MSWPDSPSEARRSRVFRLLPLAIFSVVFLFFAHTLSFDFLDWDDRINVADNHRLARLSAADFKWFLTSSAVSDFKPAVWLTYVADRLIWGLRPAGFRLTNIVLHGLNAVLVYALGLQLLGLSGGAGGDRLRRAAAVFAALLFALHPQRIESVVWISERKDVLHAFFYLAALSVYVRGPDGRRGRWVVRWTVLGMAAMLSKSMAVTLPAVLLLADAVLGGRLPAWGGGRVRWKAAVAEKMALFLAAVLTGLRALQDQSDNPAGDFMLIGTFWNYAGAIGFYTAKTFWPGALSPLYPAHALLPEGARSALLGGCAAMLLLGGWLWQQGRRLPIFLAAFFVIALAPALPIRYVADRYTYLPSLGLVGCMAGLWLEAMRRADRAAIRVALGLAAAAAVGGFCAAGATYTPVWRDSIALWSHVVRVNPGARAWYGLGAARVREGDLPGAAEALSESLRCDPESAGAYSALGEVLLRQGEAAEAERWLRRAVALNGRLLEAHQNLGTSLAMQGRLEEAVAAWQSAVALDAENYAARVNLARAFLKMDRRAEAAEQARLALGIRRTSEEAAGLLRGAMEKTPP